MRQHRLVQAILSLCAISSCSASAADDPAVSLCEYARFLGSPPADLGFARAGTALTDRRVLLIYDRAGIRYELECSFGRNTNGDFFLSTVRDPRVHLCKKKLAETAILIEQNSLDIAAAASARTEVDACQKLVDQERDVTAQLDSTSPRLITRKIPPIKASETDLK